MHAGKARHETLRIVAGESEARASGGSGVRRRLGGGLAGKSQHDRRRGDGVGEPLVIGGQQSRGAVERGELRDIGEQLGELARREAIRLGEDEVDGDRAGTGLVQGVDDGGKARARPWPLADAGERGLVDVDDAHEVARIGRARCEVEVGVEDGEAQARHRLGIGDAHHHRQGEQGRGEDQVDRRGPQVHVASRERTSRGAAGHHSVGWLIDTSCRDA